MKKITPIILCFVLLLGISACAKTGESDGPVGGDGITTEDAIVQFYVEFFMKMPEDEQHKHTYEDVVDMIGVEGLRLEPHDEDEEEEDAHQHGPGQLEGELAFMWHDTSLDPVASMTIIFEKADDGAYYVQGSGFLDGVNTETFGKYR